MKIYQWIFITFSTKILYVIGAILDSRCYLEGGGSAENFLATEDMAVGSVIGKLRINGNPSFDVGDINLSLREKNAPVKILQGTKNLILITALDKENIQGPSSIYVNVICDRRHSSDPSFVIPVNVRVTDVNDNAPQWIGAPYTLTLSEGTVPGTRILQGARAIDNDQDEAFSTVEYQVLPGLYSEYVKFLNPMNGILVLKKSLDYETTKNFTVRLRAQDQGIPPKYSDTLLRAIITDADDQNPKFSRESYRGELPLNGRLGEVKIYPEPIKAVDQDEGICSPIQYSLSSTRETKYFKIHPKTGIISLTTILEPNDLITPVILVIRAIQVDNSDRYALATVSIARPGTQNSFVPLSFVQKKFFIKIRENTPIGTPVLALPTNKPGTKLNYFIRNPVIEEIFSIGSLGELILKKNLDYENQTKFSFDIIANDGLTNATAEIAVEILDVNDWEPRFRQSHYEFLVPKTSHLNSQHPSDLIIGKIEAADGDLNDKIELSLTGSMANYFEIDDLGSLRMKSNEMINQSTIQLMVTATDSGKPPRSTSVPIILTMEGSSSIYAAWEKNTLGIFVSAIAISAFMIIAISLYIIKTKKSTKSRNRIHSEAHSTVSSTKLMTHEKISPSGNNLKNDSNALAVEKTVTNPINGHGGSESSLSAGASTIIAASLEGDVHKREKDREAYTATVRNIVSRVSAANGDSNFDCESISNTDSPQMRKWQNGRSHLVPSNGNIGSSENNLTVYF